MNEINGFVCMVYTVARGLALGIPLMLALLVFAACIISPVISRFNRRCQMDLLDRSSRTLTLVRRYREYIQGMESLSVEKGDLHTWNSRVLAAMSSVSSAARVGLIIGSDGQSIPINIFGREIHNPEKCAALVSNMIIKESGLYNLNNKEVLAWLHLVVQTIVLIRIEDMSTDVPNSEHQCLKMFNRCVSRLKGLTDVCPLMLRELDGSYADSNLSVSVRQQNM